MDMGEYLQHNGSITMRPALRDDVLTALSAHGALRGSIPEFASAFECEESEISECLLSMAKEGYLHRAPGLGTSRSVYSLTQDVVSAPAYRSPIKHNIVSRSLDALPL